MSLIERLADRLPLGLVRPASASSIVAALAGSACLFAATVFGSIVLAIVGLGAFAVAGTLWHLAAIAGETSVPRRATGTR